LGCAFRTGILMGLEFPKILWKLILGEIYTLNDLKEINKNSLLLQMSKNIANLDLLADNLKLYNIQSNYVTTVMGLNQVELIENGLETMVNINTGVDFFRRCLETKLRESEIQAEMIFKGLNNLLP
jgi:hypothetical protein